MIAVDPDKVTKTKERNAALCNAKVVIAEVIPHYRPDAYQAENFLGIAEEQRPTRITGQLFFDASHRPCRGSTPGDSSVRGSLWEVHPIYSVEVCRNRTLNDCPAADNQVWLPLNEALTTFSLKRATPQWDEEREVEHEGE